MAATMLNLELYCQLIYAPCIDIKGKRHRRRYACRFINKLSVTVEPNVRAACYQIISLAPRCDIIGFRQNDFSF